MPTNFRGTVKSKKIILVILIAVISCCLATYGLYQLLTPQRTTIYTFNSNYPAGTLVTESMLTPVEIDQELVVASNRQSMGDYFVTSVNFKNVITSAGLLRSDVNAGNALMTSMLTTTGGNSIEMAMKQNAIAVTISTNLASAVTQELSTGSRVNVYASYNDSTTLLLENIRILSIGRDGGIITTVTLEVDIAQSLRLVHAYTYGSIHLGLVDATGYQYSPVQLPTYNIAGFTDSGSANNTETTN